MIDKKKKAHSRNSGYSLVEVMIGMSIFLVVIIPLLTYSTKTAFNTKASDLQIAYALLKGESDVIYSNNSLPPPEQEIKVGVRTYKICFHCTQDSLVTTWDLKVKKKNKTIAKIKGLSYIPPG